MLACCALSPTRVAFLVVASLALLTVGAQTGAPAPINTDDYFQIPFDLYVHGHSLARHSEQIRSYKELAHRVKTADGWKTSSEAQLVSIDHKLVSDTFFYQSSDSGAVTDINSVFETVSDTVYFDQILSVTTVSCNGDFVAAKFDTSDRSVKNALTFGSKCAHYAPGVRVTGGSSFFCKTPSDSAAPVFRQVKSIISCVEDPASGRASSVKLATTNADPMTFYSSVSDYSINGSIALVPKRYFRPNSKVDFFELSRQLWKERQTVPHLRGACAGVLTDDGNCYDFDSGLIPPKIVLGGQIQKTITAFNYNYNVAANKAEKRYIPLVGKGVESSSSGDKSSSSGDSLPDDFAVGCADCYAYAGVTLKFRAAVYAYAFSAQIRFLELSADGLLTGKFMLHARTPSVEAGETISAARMIYAATEGLKIADAKASFTSVMKTFTNSAVFETKAVTPDLPSDWKGVPIVLPGVPITLTVSVGLVAEVKVNRDNQFKASVGAFARATASVGLYVFSKGAGACTDTSKLPASQYTSICQSVLTAADVTQDDIENSENSFLVKLKKQGPVVKTGFSAPTLTAQNNAKVEFGIGFYPIVRVSIFSGIFSVYLAPHLEATVTVNPSSSSCNGIEIQSPELSLKQLYAWSDVVLTVGKLVADCPVLCDVGIKIGVRAPKFLSTARPIPLPKSVTDLFPICLSTGSRPSLMPASESAIVDSSLPTSIDLCSDPPCENNVAAVMNAKAGSMPDNTQVVAALNKKPPAASGIAANIIGTISVWATDSDAKDVKIGSGKTFSLVVDVSGASSVSPLSTSTIKSMAVESSVMKSVVGLRSSDSYLFCPKSSQKDCTEADWSAKTCDSSNGCSIQGSKLTITSAPDFGIYAVSAIPASENDGSASPASQLTIAMLAAMVGLVYFFI